MNIPTQIVKFEETRVLFPLTVHNV